MVGARYDAMMRILTTDVAALRGGNRSRCSSRKSKRWRYRGVSTNETGTSVEYELELTQGL